MSVEDHPFWPWSETTSIHNTGRHFKAKFLDAQGNPMVKQFAADGFEGDQLRDALAAAAEKLVVEEGATLPEHAEWV